MWYKVINSENIIIDVLDSLNYVKFQEANRILISCTEATAQGIISSDQISIWHVDTFDSFPTIAPDYETVSIKEIDEETYENLKKELESGSEPIEPAPDSPDDEEKPNTEKPLTLGMIYDKVQENTTEINGILGKYNADELDLSELQYYKQEDNKTALKKFLQNNPLHWKDGNYYGVTQDDQNEMIADKTAYEFKQSIGQTDWKLEWHNTKHSCREFTVEEFAALLNTIIDFVYPYRKLQEAYKERIFACVTKEQVLSLNLEYSTKALKELMAE